MYHPYVKITYHGALVELWPQWARAQEWLMEHLPVDCRWGPEANPSFLVGAGSFRAVLGGLAAAMDEHGE